MRNIFLFFLFAIYPCMAIGQQYRVLYSFGGSAGDGFVPWSNLVADHSGNLFGITVEGGSSTASQCSPSSGCGTVFELSPNSDGTWTEKIIYSFCSTPSNGLCLDGGIPQASLIIDPSGNLFGTTSLGGMYSGCDPTGIGCGTVFELSPQAGGTWIEKVLYNFCENDACTDGYSPRSKLTFDANGNLYGTTAFGGVPKTSLGGTVFELSSGANGWNYSVLYNFCTSGSGFNCPDGSFPLSGVTFDHEGNLYGNTAKGGSSKNQGGGVVYKLSPTGTETVLWSFPQGGNFLGPEGDLVFDASGNLYGTAAGGEGGVFQLTPKLSIHEVLFGGNADPQAGVILDSKVKAAFGTTLYNGANQDGSVFQVGASGKVTVLYSFCPQSGCTDGEKPGGALYEDAGGNLYGTASAGGANGGGVVFEITR